jgi:hypothetical protein
MRFLVSVCLSVIPSVVLLAAQSNPADHGNQPSELRHTQSPPAGVPAQKPPVSFKSVKTYSSGGVNTVAVAVADLNGDGYPDIVLASECHATLPKGNCNGSGVVSVLLGNGDGTFGSAVTYSSGGILARGVAVGDVSGDGIPDLVVVNNVGTVGVLLGNGDGTFQPATTYGSGGYDAVSVAIGDLNGDGFQDLIVANECPIDGSGSCDGEVGVLLGSGDGTFQAPVSYGSGGYNADSVAVADVNGDGNPDLVVSNETGFNPADQGSVGVLLGNGDGTFQTATTYASGGLGSVSVAIGDLNGNGKLDLVVASLCLTVGDCENQDDGVVGVLLGNGDGTFQAPVIYDSGGWPESTPYSEGLSVAIGDVNGDGNPDLVVANSCASGDDEKDCKIGVVAVLLGNGDGTFQNPLPFSSGASYGQALAVADVNADGRPDVIVANLCNVRGCNGREWTGGTVGVLLNDFTVKTSIEVNSSLNPSQVNQSVTFTARITSSSSVPNGSTVTFYNGATEIGAGTTTTGIATLTTSFSTAGKYTIKASYPGDAFHNASSGTVKQVVNKVKN